MSNLHSWEVIFRAPRSNDQTDDGFLRNRSKSYFICNIQEHRILSNLHLFISSYVYDVRTDKNWISSQFFTNQWNLTFAHDPVQLNQ